MSKITLFLAVLAVTASSCVGRTCPPGTVASFDNSNCWLFVSVSQDFINAEQYCQAQGGHLVSIHNGFDNMYLADKAKSSFASTETFAVGGNNLQSTTNWTWIDGTPLDFTDWDNYEPANANTQNCLHIDVSRGLWHTKDCYVRAPFVCSVTNMTTTMPPTGGPATSPNPGQSTTGNPNFPTPAVGTSPAYQQASAYFASVLNPSVNPCDDFYNYTCGVYNQPMSFDSAQMSIYQDFYNAYTAPPNPSAPLPVQLVNKQYAVCLTARANWGSIVNDGSIINNIVNKFKTVTSFGFPLMDQSTATWPDSKDMGTALGYMSGALQVDTVISQFVDTNWLNNQAPNPYMINIDQPVLTLSWDYYIGSTWNITKPSLYSYVQQSFQAYAALNNIAVDATQMDADIKAILDFEHLLATGYSTDATTRWQMMRSVNWVNPTNFTAMYKFMDIDAYFVNLALFAPRVISTLTDAKFVFNLMEPGQLSKLDSAIGSSFGGQVQARTFYNYLFFRILLANSDYFPVSAKAEMSESDRILIEHFEYKKPKLGRPQFAESKFRRMGRLANKDLDDVAMSCIDDTLTYFSDASSRVFVDQVYPSDAAKQTIRSGVNKLADGIKNGMQSMIDGLSWMTAATKLGAYDKISKLTKNIAYSDSWVDDAALTQEFSELANFMNETNYYNILVDLTKFSQQASLEMLLRVNGTDRHDFNGPTGIVNAWYQPEENSITFPGGILRQPFYDPDWPNSIVYGSMGMVVGHELSHGFDSSGTQYDGTGNLHTWMDNQTQVSFNNMTACVINEYSGFCPLDPAKYTPNCINGQQTVGENVADNAGIHSSYRAYKNAVDFGGEDPRLPGPLMSQFTHDQLFFLAFSRLWCQQKPDPSREYVQLLVDPHSPSKYRVFGTLQNYPAFKNAFNCPINSGYTPAKHCNVWVSDIN